MGHSFAGLVTELLLDRGPGAAGVALAQTREYTGATAPSTRQSPALRRPERNAMNQSPVLLHIWNVHPEAEAGLVEQLAEMFRHVNGDPGLVSARILASPDRTSVAALVEMRTPEDRKRLEELPEVRETLHAVQDGAYNLIITLYHEVGRIP